tara:strand:+ start:242 stop:364 length:123 start_codon:yes stop_codon:yes gene_type:complete
VTPPSVIVEGIVIAPLKSAPKVVALLLEPVPIDALPPLSV